MKDGRVKSFHEVVIEARGTRTTITMKWSLSSSTQQYRDINSQSGIRKGYTKTVLYIVCNASQLQFSINSEFNITPIVRFTPAQIR